MSSFANMQEKSTFTPAPVGAHGARLYQAIDLGTQESSYYGPKRKVLLIFELPGKLMDSGEPFTVSNWYTASLSKKSNLRQDLISWMGRDLIPEEIQNFDWGVVKDIPCLVNVVHHTKDDGTVIAKIQSISPVPEGMDVAPLNGEQVIFDLANPDDELFESLSDGIKKMIMGSPEYRMREQEPENNQSDFVDDDLDEAI